MKNSSMPWKTCAVLSEIPISTWGRFATEVADPEHESREQHPDRVQPPEEGRDDRGEAVARRDGGLELADRSRHLTHPGEPPASAPARRKQNHTMRGREKPPKPPARGASPLTRISNPLRVRDMNTNSTTTVTTARCTRPSPRVGRSCHSWKLADWGKL